MNGPRWIKQWIADLALLNEQFRDDEGSIDFEALGREEYLFRTALITQNFSKSERAKDTYAKAKAAYDASSENGKKGGRPRKNPEENSAETAALDSQVSTVAPSTGAKSSTATVRSMPTTEQLYDFARAESLDEADARDWYEMTVVDRGGKDRNGNRITNWKAACKKFCVARAQRRTA